MKKIYNSAILLFALSSALTATAQAGQIEAHTPVTQQVLIADNRETPDTNIQTGQQQTQTNVSAQPLPLTQPQPDVSSPPQSLQPNQAPQPQSPLLNIYPQVITNPEMKAANHKSFDFYEVVAKSDLTLRGVNPSYTIYLPVPKQWKLSGVKLRLLFSHSPVLNRQSTLTAEVGDTPISTIHLTSENSEPTFWDINIPNNAIQQDILAVKFSGYLRITDDVCADLENPGLWLRLLQDSVVNYSYDELNYVPNLLEYPQPFIQAQAPGRDSILILLPSTLSFNSFVPAFYTANVLGSQSNWRGLNLDAKKIDSASSEDKEKNNVLLAGTSQAFDLDKINPQWPLKINANGAFMSDGKQVSSSSGVLMLSPSPWNAKRALLAVTGESDEAVIKSAFALHQPLFPKLAPFTSNMLIPALLTKEADAINWDAASLKLLGYDDQVVSGNGQLTIHDIVTLPGNYKPKSMTAKIQFSHAEFISPQSYLMLTVNGVPQGGVSLTTNNTEDASLNVKIPGKYLIAGKNSFDFLFDIRLSEEGCKIFKRSQAWGTIYSNSILKTKFYDELPTLRLQEFAAPFTTNNLLVLPASDTLYSEAASLKALIKLGGALKINPAELKIITANEVNEDILRKDNVILIGTFDNNPWITKFLQSSVIKLLDNHLVYQSNSQNVSMDLSQAGGMIQLAPSPWNTRKAALVITATSQVMLVKTLALLTDPEIVTKLAGNILFVKEDGKYNLFHAETASSLNPSQQMNNSSTSWNKLLNNISQSSPEVLIIMASAFIVILIIFIVLIVAFLRRKSK